MIIIKLDYIRDKLSYIESKVKNDTKQKLYDINKTAEDIFMHILNDVYGWELVNANDIKPNFPAIDLIDTTNEIVIQITSSINDAKVTSTIEKFSKFADDDYKDGTYQPYAHYDLKMFYIKDKPTKFTKATDIKIENQNMNLIDDFLGIEDINTKVSANPTIATKVFKTLCEILHDKVCDADTPSQLTIKSSTHDNNFIGREDQVQVIDTMLKDSNSLLLINGIGGIGKSSLANHYLYTRENKFDYYGFIEGLDSFISEFRNSLDLKAEKEEELYREIIFKLQDLKGKKLLVIDNVEDIESHKELIEMILSLHKYDYKILFTSRRKIKNVTAYPLGTLLLDDARELFLSYFKTDELEKVDGIINYLGLHTLFIKLVAETIENEGYSLDNILKKFANGELSKIEFIDDESGDEVTFNQNLQELFSMQNLKDEYVLLLKRLAVLPPIDIELSFLEEILGKERLKGRLNFLVGRGWLIENDGSYKLHQIIKEFLLANYVPCFEEIEEIVEFFYEFIKNSADIRLAIYIQDSLGFFISIVKTLEILENCNEKLSDFYLSLGTVYLHLGNYNISLIYFQKSLTLRKNIFGDKNFKVAEVYNNMAGYYRNSGESNRALILYEEALSITIETFGKNHEYTIRTYSNIAELYTKLGHYKEALPLYKKVLRMGTEYLGDDNFLLFMIHNGIARLYTRLTQNQDALFHFQKALALSSDISYVYKVALYLNIAELYENTEKYSEALSYALQAIKIKEQIYAKNHPSTASNYNFLAGIYLSLEEYALALNFYEKALKIRREVLGDFHPDTAITYNDLGYYYFSKKEQKKALYFYNKSLQIREKALDKNHIHLAQSYKNVASCYHSMSLNKEALVWLKKALKIEEEVLPKNHPQLIDTKSTLEILQSYTVMKSGKRTSRNDPCPCNSGKKYKKCCGKPK